jgi:hypothetical protein
MKRDKTCECSGAPTYPHLRVGCGNTDVACELRVRIDTRFGAVTLLPTTRPPGAVEIRRPDGAASSSCSPCRRRRRRRGSGDPRPVPPAHGAAQAVACGGRPGRLPLLAAVAELLVVDLHARRRPPCAGFARGAVASGPRTSPASNKVESASPPKTANLEYRRRRSGPQWGTSKAVIARCNSAL